MDINGEYTFDAPQDIVWEAVLDPDVLGSVLPGGQGFEETGENEYAGALKVKVGPVQGVFKANIVISDIVPPESYVIDVDGRGAPGFVKATGNLKLEGRGEQTYMEYGGSAKIGGRIASVGQRLIDASAKSIIRQSLEGLNAYLKAKYEQVKATEAASSDASADDGEAKAIPPTEEIKVDYTPPSQTQVAMTVAKDTINEIIPPALQPVIVIGVLGVIGVVIWLIVG